MLQQWGLSPWQGQILLVGARANIEDGSSLIIHWSSGSLGRGLERGHRPPPHKKNHFWTSKSLVLVRFIAIFVSSSTTDGLLRNDLSGGEPLLVGGPGPWPPGPPKSGPGLWSPYFNHWLLHSWGHECYVYVTHVKTLFLINVVALRRARLVLLCWRVNQVGILSATEINSLVSSSWLVDWSQWSPTKMWNLNEKVWGPKWEMRSPKVGLAYN